MYETVFWITVETTNLNYQLVSQISSSNSIQVVVSNILSFHSKNFGKKSSILTIIFFKGGWAKNHQPGQPGYHLIPEPLQKSTLGTPGFPRWNPPHRPPVTPFLQRLLGSFNDEDGTMSQRGLEIERSGGSWGDFFGGVGDFVLSGEQKKMEGPLKVGVGWPFVFFCFGGDSRKPCIWWLNFKSKSGCCWVGEAELLNI